MVATATISRREISETAIVADPNSSTISGNVIVVLSTTVENGGRLNFGTPAAIFPVRINGVDPLWKKMYAITAPPISTKAFLANDRYFVKVLPRPV